MKIDRQGQREDRGEREREERERNRDTQMRFRKRDRETERDKDSVGVGRVFLHKSTASSTKILFFKTNSNI